MPRRTIWKSISEAKYDLVERDDILRKVCRRAIREFATHEYASKKIYRLRKYPLKIKLSGFERRYIRQFGLFRALSTYDPSKGTKFKTWVFRCVYEECRIYLSQGMKGIGALPQDCTTKPLQEWRVECTDTFSTLPADQLQIIIDRLSGYTLQETADRAGLSMKAVRIRLAAGTDRLSRIVG